MNMKRVRHRQRHDDRDCDRRQQRNLEQKHLKEAARLIDQALDIMTVEQVSQWEGVRAWQERPPQR